MTGDVNVNVDASVLVMTRDFRNMYKTRELVREVQWVIFDEVHTCGTRSAA